MNQTTWQWNMAGAIALLPFGQAAIFLLAWFTSRAVIAMGRTLVEIWRTQQLMNTFSVTLSGEPDPKDFCSTTSELRPWTPCASAAPQRSADEPPIPCSRVGFVPPPSGTSPSSTRSCAENKYL